MLRLMIIAPESKTLIGLFSELIQNDFNLSIVSQVNGIAEKIKAQPPDMILWEVDGHLSASTTGQLISEMKRQRFLPTIALATRDNIDSIDGDLDVDDFLISPYDVKELLLRIKRLLKRTRDVEKDHLIKCNGLVIDTAKCEVTVEGKLVELTFKEYELLRFLAKKRGRVYSREALLNKIWGYDYYGGDRTIDVHIRRLRSKIENYNHQYIETVRNIGYRFRVD